MEEYLVSYEYKEKDGCLISTKTKTEVLSLHGLNKLTTGNDYYDNYIKILFCQKL